MRILPRKLLPSFLPQVSKKKGTQKRRIGKRVVTTPRVGSAQWMIHGGYIGVESRKSKKR